MNVYERYISFYTGYREGNPDVTLLKMSAAMKAHDVVVWDG